MSIFKTKYVNGIDIIVTVCSCGGNLEVYRRLTVILRLRFTHYKLGLIYLAFLRLFNKFLWFHQDETIYDGF